MSILLDTGSNLLWLPHKGCTTQGTPRYCNTPDVYDEAASTSQKVLADPFKVTYGAKTIEGKFIQDNLVLGDPAVTPNLKIDKPITFGAADKITGVADAGSDQGTLGLSFSPPGEKGTSIFQQLLNDKKLERPLLTIFYSFCAPLTKECADKGLVTFGKHDIKSCG
jgi:hypothetical protein